MIELQVIGGCKKEGPCDQGSLSGEGFHVVTEVDVKDKSVYDDTAFSPQLIDKETGLPFMESIMTRFPTMDFTCPFCNAPTKVNGVTNMNGVAVKTETAREIKEKAEESKETMGEAEPWDTSETSMADSLLGDGFLDDVEDSSGGHPGEEPLDEDPLDEDPLEEGPLDLDDEDDSTSFEESPDPDDPIII